MLDRSQIKPGAPSRSSQLEAPNGERAEQATVQLISPNGATVRVALDKREERLAAGYRLPTPAKKN